MSNLDDAFRSLCRGRRMAGVEPPFMFTRAELARELGVSLRRAGNLLQSHRLAQGRGRTRFIVAAEGYGCAARWHVLGEPRTDRVTVAEMRKRHALYIARDSMLRYWRDRLNELMPSLGKHESDALVTKVSDYYAHQFEGAFTFLESMLNGRGDDGAAGGALR